MRDYTYAVVPAGTFADVRPEGQGWSVTQSHEPGFKTLAVRLKTKASHELWAGYVVPESMDEAQMRALVPWIAGTQHPAKHYASLAATS